MCNLEILLHPGFDSRETCAIWKFLYIPVFYRALNIGTHVIVPVIYVSNRQHLAFLASVALFWLGSDFSAEHVS